MTLDDPRVGRSVNEGYVATYYNLDAGDDFQTPGKPFLDECRSGRECDWSIGDGSAQVGIYLCGADRRIERVLPGFTPPEALVQQLDRTKAAPNLWPSLSSVHGERIEPFLLGVRRPFDLVVGATP